jgi:hypothetical protein
MILRNEYKNVYKECWESDLYSYRFDNPGDAEMRQSSWALWVLVVKTILRKQGTQPVVHSQLKEARLSVDTTIFLKK